LTYCTQPTPQPVVILWVFVGSLARPPTLGGAKKIRWQKCAGIQYSKKHPHHFCWNTIIAVNLSKILQTYLSGWWLTYPSEKY